MWGRGRGKQIGAVGVGPGKYSKFKGGGRGRGRGGRRNGREKVVLTKMVDGKEVRSTNYNADEFRKLTKTQRDAVKELRNRVKEQRTNNNGGNDTNNNTNNVNAVATETLEERIRNMERAVIAGVSNASGATTDSGDNASSITGNHSVLSNNTGTSSATGYLRQRRNNQNHRSSHENNN